MKDREENEKTEGKIESDCRRLTSEQLVSNNGITTKESYPINNNFGQQ